MRKILGMKKKGLKEERTIRSKKERLSGEQRKRAKVNL